MRDIAVREHAENQLTVSTGSLAFPGFRSRRQMTEGKTLLEILGALGITGPMHPYLRIRINGVLVLAFEWATRRPRAGEHVNISLLPAGAAGQIDKEILRGVIGVVSVLGGQIFTSGVLGLSGPAQWLAMAGLSVAGMWAAQTLIPLVPDKEFQFLQLSGARNQARQNEPIPKVYGTQRIYPPLAATPITLVEGDEQYIVLLFALGYKPLHIHDGSLKLGDTPLAHLDGVTMEINDGYEHFQFISLYTSDVAEAFLDQELNYSRFWRVQATTREDIPDYAPDGDLYVPNPNAIFYTTQAETVRIGVDVSFPQGIGRMNGDTLEDHGIEIQFQMRKLGETGEASWSNVIPPRYLAVRTENGSLLTLMNLFGWLDRLNTAMASVNTTLAGIPEAQRDTSAYDIEDRFPYTLTPAQSTLDDVQGFSGWNGDQTTTLATLETRLTDLAAIVATIPAATTPNATFLLTIMHAYDCSALYYQILTLLAMIKMGFSSDHIARQEVFSEFLVLSAKYPDIFGNLYTGAFTVRNAERKRGPIRKSFAWPVRPGTYEVRIRKASQDKDDSEWLDEVRATAVRSVRQAPAVSPAMRDAVALVALKLKATDQVNGIVDQFNCIVTAPLYYSTDGEDQLGPAIVDSAGQDIARNPAWQYVDALTGGAVRSPVTWSQIDWARIFDFAGRCNVQGWHFDYVFDRGSTLQAVLEDICRAAKASPTIRDATFSVIEDIPRSESNAVITLRNTSGFTAAKGLDEKPHAVRIGFTNPAKGWIEDAQVIYLDGYGEAGGVIDYDNYHTAATDEMLIEARFLSINRIFDTLRGTEVIDSWFEWSTEVDGDGIYYTRVTPIGRDFETEFSRYRVSGRAFAKPATFVQEVRIPGLVDCPEAPENEYYSGQVYKLGRYLLAVLEHRPETFEAELDFENLVFERGDRVELQMDTVLWGLGAGRVTAVEQTETSPGSGEYYLTEITVDAQIAMEAGKRYELKVRGDNGSISPAQGLITVAGWQNAVSIIDRAHTIPFQVKTGDLAFWGEVNLVTIPCLVKEIRYKRDLAATVTLIQESGIIHRAEDGPIPPYDPQITIPPTFAPSRPPRPHIVDVVTDESAIVRNGSGALESRIALTIGYDNRADNPALLPEVHAVDVQFRLSSFAVAPDALWTDAGTFPGGARDFSVGPVQDKETYHVRVRSRASNGVASEWFYRLDVYVTGKGKPPPDVRRVEMIRDNLFWSYNPPIDFAGFQVRAYRGENLSWKAAEPMHEGLITQTMFRIEHFGQGGRTFLVKAFDVAGNESVNASWVSEPREPGVDIMRTWIFPHSFWTWPGIKTNLSINGSNQLVVGAGNKDTFYYDLGGSPYQDSADAAYSTSYKEGIYEFSFPTGYPQNIRHELDFRLDVTAEKWRFDMRVENPDLWPEELADDIWPLALADDFWPRAMHWAVMNSRIRIESGRIYNFRVVIYPANTQGVITEVDEGAYAERITEFLPETAIANPPAAIYLSRAYSVLTSVVATLVKNTGTPNAVRVEIQNNFKGIFSDRIYVAAYDAAGVLCTGTADIYVEGY